VHRIAILIVCSLALAGWLDRTKSEEPRAGAEDRPQPSIWMKKKLEYAEQVLAGLASEDFDQISRSAKAMNALSQIENWVHATRPNYRTQLTIFRDANEQLIARANDSDLDGATLAYLQLTLSCVNCHKAVRDAKATKANP